MKKVRTTIRIDESALEAIRKSGVRNVSEYTQNLWLEDIKRQKEVTKKESAALERIDEKLDRLHNEWEKLSKEIPRRY